MAIRHEDVLASMSPESRARIAEASARLKANHRAFLELRDADPTVRDTPEFYARLSALPDEYRAELFRLEAERAGLGGLRKQVEALGGMLKITAEFPDGGVVLIEDDRSEEEEHSCAP